MRARITTLVATSALLLFGAGVAQAETTYDFSFGSPGGGRGQFNNPADVAPNQTTGDVYVADEDNHRIQQFDSDGNFIRMWGRGVNQTTGGDICPVDPGDVCVAGTTGGQAGWFNDPRGIAVDSASGDVYVQDNVNNRIQKFTGEGIFLRMWGKEVNQQTGGNFCIANTGFTCQAGLSSGTPADPGGAPAVPSEPGVFSGWSLGEGLLGNGRGVAVDADGNVYVLDYAIPRTRIQKFDPDGNLLADLAPDSLLTVQASNLSVGPLGDVYVSTATHPSFLTKDGWVVQFDPDAFVPSSTASRRRAYGAGSEIQIARLAVDLSNGYVFASASGCRSAPGDSGLHIVEYHPISTEEADCSVPGPPVTDRVGSMEIDSELRRLYMTDDPLDQIHVLEIPSTEPPEILFQTATDITSRGAKIDSQIVGNLGDTTHHIEYGSTPCSDVPSPCESTPETTDFVASKFPEPVSSRIDDLKTDTRYFYRVVATNEAGSFAGPDRSFRTFAQASFDPSCENNLARQQTGAAFLLDCRAYELVSASDQGGYNVASDLVPGQQPYGGFPQADDKALYAVHNGGIPNTGNPTNRGPDPYVATRDPDNERWNTEYVGISATVPSLEPFSSTVAGADSSLSSFAFGGPEICDPCLGDGSSGIPLRRPDGSLVQGMGGSVQILDPEPTGEVRKPLSDDGTNLVFASTQQFVLEANHDDVNITIFNRDLESNITRIVSRNPDTTVMQEGEDVVALDLSADGSRTLIGVPVSTDAEGNRHFHLYMHVGSAINTIDLTPGTTTGVLYAGMNNAGNRVYFTTRDPLQGDADTSVDLYRADVGSASSVLSRVSTGTGAGNTDSCDPAENSYNNEDWNVIPGGPTDCSVVAIGGGGGVSSGNGTVYFLSPEILDGNGTEGAPNLFYSRPGQALAFVETLESSEHEPLADPVHRFKQSFGAFSYPEGVAIDTGNDSGFHDDSVYVLDTIANSGQDEEGNSVPTAGAFVQKFDTNGEPDLAFGQDSKTDGSDSAAGPFQQAGLGFGTAPIGVATQIAVDNSGGPSDGVLYVPDFGHGVVDRFDSDGDFISQIILGGLISPPPSGVGVSPSGRVHVTSSFSNLVYTFNQNGFSTAPTSFPVAGPALGVAVDLANNSYVVNGQDTRVYNSAGSFVKVLDPNPSFGVSIDPTDEHVYVDRGNFVVEYDETGTEVGRIGAGLLGGSVSLAVHNGQMAISNPDRGNIATYTPRVVPPDARYDNPMVLNGVRDPETRHTADFQVTPDGDYATFQSGRQITGFDNADQYEVFRHDALGEQTDCVSCPATNAEPITDASLPSNGLGLTDDGRVFFNTGERLVLRDSNARRDAYQWSRNEDDGEPEVELISSGQSPFDSGLLSVSADGTDAFFFTRETLVESDGNGNLMKLYTAREEGGFFKLPPEPPCKASDECHGPGSEPAPPIDLGTLEGSGGNAPQPEGKQANGCDIRKLERRARGFSRRAKALRRRAVRSSNRRASRRLRVRSRRFARGARKNAVAAKRCRARTKARRAAR